jgi:hypothetical protein
MREEELRVVVKQSDYSAIVVGEFGKWQYALGIVNDLGTGTSYRYQRLPVLEMTSHAVKAGL